MHTRDHLELVCEHDQNDPSHLVCKEEIKKNVGNPIWEFFYTRWHKHYHPRRRHGKKHLVADIIILSCIAVLLIGDVGLRIVLPTIFPRTVNVSFSLPEGEISSGLHAEFPVTIENNLREDIINTSLTIDTPLNGIEFGEPLFPIGTIKNGKTVQKIVSGIPFGALGQEQELKGVLLYATDDGNEKTIVFRKRFHIARSDVRMEVGAAQEGYAAERITIATQFDGPEQFEKIPAFAVFRMPRDFVVETSSPVHRGTTIDLPAWKNTRASITGYFPLAARGKRVFEVKFFLKKNGESFLQIQRKHEMNLTAPPLALSVIQRKGTSLQSGKRGDFRIVWKNISSMPLRNIRMSVQTAGDALGPRSLASAIGVKQNDMKIRWSKTQEKELKEVSAGAEGSFAFSVTPTQLENLTAYSADHDFALSLSPYASYVGEDARTISTFGAPLSVPLASHMSLLASAHYFSPEGEQIGRGPLPPIVGKTTRYVVQLEVRSTIHPLESVKLSAHLPNGVTVKRSLDGTPFTVRDGVVTWNIGSVPSALGIDSKQARGKQIIFELAFTPPPSHRGGIAPLLTDISAEGKDRSTGTDLSATAIKLTTALTPDSRERQFSQVQ